MKRAILAMAVVSGMMLPASIYAHFVFLVQKQAEGKKQVQVYFSEDGTPDNPEYLERLTRMSTRQVKGAGEATDLKLNYDKATLSTELTADKGPFVTSKFEYGVSPRGGYLIRYYAKSGPALNDAAWKTVDTSKLVDVDVIPELVDGKVQATVLWRGKPAAKAEVTATIPGQGNSQAQTDDNGKVSFPQGAAGLYVLRARVISEEAGDFENTPYTSVRSYGTLTFPGPGSEATAVKLPNLDPMVTSLGGAVIDDTLYVYGGNLGDAHSYHKGGQSGTLRRLKLDGQSAWETVSQGPTLQGLAMVAFHGKLYRVGGFTALNAEDEDNNLVSQTLFSSFDPKTGEWTELPALPAGRSSHDVAVIGRTLYVVGGWTLGGKDNRKWHETALSYDLTSEKGEWKEIAAPPFQRRALGLAAHNGKLFAIGGMDKKAGPCLLVSVYDPKSNTWSEGPSIIGADMTGFGCSAFATGGQLYVSTCDGNLQRLKEDGSAWEIVKQLPTARFFHRMLPVDSSHFVFVGGASTDTGKFGQVDILPVN